MEVDLSRDERTLIRHLCQREIVDFGEVANGELQKYLTIASRLEKKITAYERKASKKN